MWMHIIIHYYKGLGFSERLWVDYTSEKELLVPWKEAVGTLSTKVLFFGGGGREGWLGAGPTSTVYFLSRFSEILFSPLLIIFPAQITES